VPEVYHGQAIRLRAPGRDAGRRPRAARALVAPWKDAGCNWWLDARWEMPPSSPERVRQVRERLAAGPPQPA